jgi:glycosyltransferase involved in cell wall biosynthesis
MRIAWFSPGSGQSGVVDYSRRVLEAMRHVAAPVLFSYGPAERFPDGVPVVDFSVDQSALARLSEYDAVIYNLGNSLHYHWAIWEAARSHPGILILHDRVLHHFFAAYFLASSGSSEAYRECVARLYGPTGAAIAERRLEGRAERDPLFDYSFIEYVVQAARGVVVHSRWHADAVREAWKGPICELWLPTHGAPAGGPPAEREDDRVTLLTLGHVEFNKHCEKVLQAFANDRELVARARYLIAGAYDQDAPYVQTLSRAITSNSLGGSVDLLGYLSPAELEAQASAADVFVNLRWPNFEGCSASLMYQLPFGKPVLVYGSGSFAELPDDAVVKVKPGDDRELQRRLLELVGSEARRAEVGAAGRRFAATKAPPSYVRELLEFAADVGRWSPYREVAGRIGQALAALGADPQLAGVEQVTREAVSLFGRPHC